MRRFKLAFVVACTLAAIAVAGGSAADFEADNGPCPETPGNTALLRCPTAYVGQAYEVQIESEEGSGCTSPGNPYIWYEIVNSTLPDGLSMTRSGLISGTPRGAGLGRFWVWNHDLTAAQGGPSWCQREDRSEREFSIPIDPGLAISNESVPPATLGQPYSVTLRTTRVVALNTPGPTVQSDWSLQSGSLPPGITLSTSGALAGTPTAEGSYQFTLKAQNASPFDTQQFTLSVRQPMTVKSPFAPAPRPSAEIGIRFGKTVTATGGSGTYKWSLAAGALPAGVVLNPTTGSIAGTPQQAGNYVFVVAGSDTEGRVATANAALTVAPRLTLKTLRLPAGKLGRAYQASLAKLGGVKPVTWQLTGRLPAGVRFAKTLGALSGTPRAAGTFRLSVQAVDALRAKAQAKLVLDVKP